MLIWAIVTCMVIGIFIFLNSQASEQTLASSIVISQYADSTGVNGYRSF
ncbi:hypothetical protein [Priestia abyssalis]|nr:hypothetical protein [Priestia abyssalis]